MNAGARNQRSGAALILAVVLVMVLGIGASAVWRYLHITLKETTRQEKLAVALHLAEAGLDKAVAELRTTPEYRGEQNTPLGQGRFSVVATTTAKDNFHLVSTGEMAEEGRVQGTVVLAADLALGPDRMMQRYCWHMEHEKR
ncbi:MAG TPA: hypothetical protein PLI09_11840 [Candidatus Hydrogenedentes bacterium]|nr:hypothetical protein [Candidatus Hydrogenedentota bacterium]